MNEFEWSGSQCFDSQIYVDVVDGRVRVGDYEGVVSLWCFGVSSQDGFIVKVGNGDVDVVDEGLDDVCILGGVVVYGERVFEGIVVWLFVDIVCWFDVFSLEFGVVGIIYYFFSFGFGDGVVGKVFFVFVGWFKEVFFVYDLEVVFYFGEFIFG